MVGGAASGYRISVVVEIHAAVGRVWRALCDPAEVAAWDPGVAGALDAPADYPAPGQRVRWRVSSGPFRILHDRILEVVPERMLHSALGLGPWRYDELYTLVEATGGCRLRAEVVCRAALPLGSTLIERLYLGPSTRRSFEASLAGLKSWCERPG